MNRFFKLEDKYLKIIDNLNLSSLKNKSVFITGGTGFFGYWILNLVTNLNTLGYNIQITLLSRNPDQFLNKNPVYISTTWLKWIKGDIIDYKIPDTKFDLIIHGAANTSPLVFDKPVLVFNEIVKGTYHVLEHSLKCEAKRFLNISSGAVYGAVNFDKNINEDETNAPITNQFENAYGEAKRSSEMLVHCFSKEYKLEVITARCFTFIGIGIGEHLAISNLIKQALFENTLIIKGNGKALRSFMHGLDLSIWLFKLLIDGKSKEIYNVGSDDSYSIKEIAELIRDLIAPNKEVIIQGTLQKEQRLNYIPSVNKAKELGLNNWKTLSESIKELSYFFQKENGKS